MEHVCVHKTLTYNRCMKTFPWIVINKSDMNNPKHYKDAVDVALYVYNAHSSENYKNYIIIKDENTVIDIEWLKDVPEQNHIKHSRLVRHLEKYGS